MYCFDDPLGIYRTFCRHIGGIARSDIITPTLNRISLPFTGKFRENPQCKHQRTSFSGT